ncbi:GPR1/FUN34/yaaH family-domain-containing protein [Phialemonium atrogriseum]|uniref:GPR1/FUN34/yaaH family-domain-containing protein n=1 Tax=Phialemonium atrogriseum TaxID=1093897 RepID=A0AAJ0BTP5_9PEZI|nr:GPR1/FUN34/yaaH family-domain-containing protein [Phialemonium atrogriseum]KAK1764304.1 GPR1/FUN34/yaaH family-domain-containing protein [Phialemonium atrogriseum]
MATENKQDTPSYAVRDEEKGLHRTTTGVTMSPELFEKLYLTPKVPHAGDYNKRFANPTALGFVGFVISTFTFSTVLMGWGGASGLTPVAGIFFFVGPVLLVFSMVFEWIMGNFFPMMVMGLFAVFWLSFGLLQLPTLGLATPYATEADPSGMASPEYNATVAMYLLIWGFALFTFFIFTTKINAVFAMIFLLVSSAAWVLAGAYWKVSTGDFAMAGHLQTAGGALLFVVAVLGWYMCFVIMAGEMRLNINFPVGDLSRFWPRTDVPIDNDHED